MPGMRHHIAFWLPQLDKPNEILSHVVLVTNASQ
jgi:hypothetical protein